MKLLELFSGTGSVGKVARPLGYEVVSLDLKNADINCDIMTWDYRQFKPGEFDIIWASPPCTSFSIMQRMHMEAEAWEARIQREGLPILRRTQEIIDYFKPKLWFIENPQTGRMKEFLDLPFYDVDYCMYSDWGYRKRTRVWTNKEGFHPLLCDKTCGTHVSVKILSLNDRYRIPPNLIESLLRSD